MKQQLSMLLRRYPWLGRLIVRLYRVTQARYTAGVIGVLLDEQGRVLLVEHVFHFGEAWGLPGGWMGRGEDPASAIAREIREETGLVVQAAQPILVRNSPFWGTHLDIAFLLTAEAIPSDLTLSNELLNYGWYALDQLPPIKDFHREVLRVVQFKMQNSK